MSGLVIRGIAAAFLAAVSASAPLTAQWRDPSPHQTHWVTVDSSVRLEVLEWGSRGRTILFVGCYLTAHVYDDIAPKLAETFHVYAVTRRGVGASDRPATGYDPQRRADDILEVMTSLGVQKPILVGNSCGGDILHTLGADHRDRVAGLVYLNAAEDFTLKMADYNSKPVDMTRLPPRVARPRPPVKFPEAEGRQRPLDAAIRKAIVDDNKVRPPYARIRVPVLAMWTTTPLEEALKEFPPRNEQERIAVAQAYAEAQAMLHKWEGDLRAGVPSARIVEVPNGGLYMFLSNEADVVREVRAFAATLPLQAETSPFQGRWIADLAASRLHPGLSVRSISVTFVVTPDRVRITDDVVSAAGQQIGQGFAEFITDDQEHPNDTLLKGLVVRARWVSPRRLETVLKRASGIVERVNYEVSPDDSTLTNTTEGPLGSQRIIFRR